MVALRRAHMPSALSVLKLQPSKHFFDKLFAIFLWARLTGTEHVLRPRSRPASLLLLLVGPGQQTFSHLKQKMRQVKGFCRRQLRPFSQGLLQLILQPQMARRGSFQGRHCDEKGRQTHLADTIYQSLVHGLPVHGAEDPARHGTTKGRARGVLCSSQGAGQPKVVDKMLKLITCSVANDWKKKSVAFGSSRSGSSLNRLA